MCVVSMIGDGYEDAFPDRWPTITVPVTPIQGYPAPPFTPNPANFGPFATQEDVNKLREEIVELRKVLQQAATFNKKTGQPNCEQPIKLRLILALAAALGVDMSEFAKPAEPSK